MASDFDSFDSSILGAFIQSDLDARGDGVVLFSGDLFVVHAGSTFDGVTTNGFAYYNTDTSLWAAVPTTTFFTPLSSVFLTSGTRFFALTSGYNLFLYGTSGGTTKFQSPATTAWRDDLGYSSNWPQLNTTDEDVIMDLQGDLLIMNTKLDNTYQNVTLAGTPTASNNIVKHNPSLGYFESFGAAPENILVDEVITHDNYIVVTPLRGMIAVTLSPTGYTSALVSDLGATVTFKETGDFQQSTGSIDTLDTPASTNTFTVNIDGQTESIVGFAPPESLTDALVTQCNESTQSNFQNVTFSRALGDLRAYGDYPGQTYTATLSVSGSGTGTVTNFSDAFVADTITYASGPLKRFNNATRTWYVQTGEITLDFFNNYADVAITSGTGAGTYESTTPIVDETGFYYTTNGSVWNASSIQYQTETEGTAYAGSAGGRLFVGGNSIGGLAPPLISGATESGLFEWNIAADTYTAIDCDKFTSFDNFSAIGSTVYFRQLVQGIPSDGIYKLSGTTPVIVSAENIGDDSTGLSTFETRGADLLVGTNASTLNIAKPPNNFFQLLNQEYIEYLGTSGTSASGLLVSKIINPEKTAALTLMGSWVGLSIISATPTLGPQSGGTSISITGTGFTESTTVTFDGNAATNVSYISATSLTCDTPAGTGTVDVVVTDSGNSDTLTNGYTYEVALSIISVAPTSGTTAGGTSVTVTGTGFIDGVTTVAFDRDLATNVVFNSSTEVTCDTPAHVAGTIDVIVYNGADNDTLTNGYTYT